MTETTCSSRPRATGRTLAGFAVVAALCAGSLMTASGPARADAVADPLVYVAAPGGMSGGEIDILDTVTGSVLSTIPTSVVNEPTDLAFNTAGTQGYIADNEYIKVLDTATGTIIATVTLPDGGLADAIALSPDGGLLYVADFYGALDVFDTATDTFLAAIPLAQDPGHLALSPDGSRLYISYYGDNDYVSVFDTATDTIAARIPTGYCLCSTAISPDGTTAYITTAGGYETPGDVLVVDTATDAVTATIPVGPDPYDVAVSPDGSAAYVIDDENDTVSVIDTSTDTVRATVPVGVEPTEVSMNAAGTLVYVLNTVGSSVTVIDAGTDTVTATIPTEAPNPTGLAAPVAVQPTSTSLSSSPAATAVVGTAVTLTATVAPSTPGTVQFFDGGVSLGTPVLVDVDTATETTSALTTTGAHSLSAVFTPAADTSAGSTSATVPYQITATPLALEQTITRTGTGTLTTAPFTTSGPVQLVAFTSSDGPATAQTTTVTGAGLTWTPVQRANPKGTGDAEIWTAQTRTALSGATITSTPKTGGYDQSLTVLAFGGSGGVGASAVASKAKGVLSVSLTTTQPDSWVFGVGEDYSKAVARTLGPNQSLISQWVDDAAGETFWVQSQAGPTPTAGTDVTVNDTAATGDTWNLAAVEIVPASG